MSFDDQIIKEKYEKLKGIIREHESLVIAYSGGLDSGFLLYMANMLLGDKVIGVIALSPSVSKREREGAENFAKEINALFKTIEVHEFDDENYLSNPPERCYYCKLERFKALLSIAKEFGIQVVADGTNVDDLDDYRPGLKAAQELKVVSPLLEAGLSKEEIRKLAKNQGLSIWNKPANPCLASRVPYGSRITPEKLKQIEICEDYLVRFGIPELRVRHFGELAVIEVPKEYFSIVDENRENIMQYFKKAGFGRVEKKVFKSGALNKI